MYKLFILGKNKIIKFFPKKEEQYKKLPYLQLEEVKKQSEINADLLNFNLNLISLIINQEYEILKLQNYRKVENNQFLYELLCLGLKEKFLEWTNIKPLVEAFYQTNRLTKNQYLTLTKHLYLEDKEYE